MKGSAFVLLFALAGTAYSNDEIPRSLTGSKGDPARGRAIVADRRVGLCLLCHSGPFPEERFQGTLAPPPPPTRQEVLLEDIRDLLKNR